LLALWTAAALAQGQQSPDSLVKQVADDVLGALREDPDLRDGNQTKMAHSSSRRSRLILRSTV
jgi:hypothetical protein